MNTAFKFFAGWTLILVIGYMFTKLEGTRTILYYLLWLAVTFMLVTHYQDFKDLLGGTQLPGLNPSQENNKGN